jgi:hypothetical protein
VNAIVGEWLSGLGEGGLREAEEVDRVEGVGLGDLGDDRSVEGELDVAGASERDVSARSLLIGEGGDEHEAGLALAMVGGELSLDPLIEVSTEGVEPCPALEGLVEAPVGEKDAGMEMGADMISALSRSPARLEGARSHVKEEAERRSTVGARAEGHLITGKAEVAYDEPVVGMGGVEERLEPAVVLLAIGDTRADDGDMVALA